MASPPTWPTPPPAPSTPGSTWRWRSSDPAYAPPARGVGVGCRQRGGGGRERPPGAGSEDPDGPLRHAVRRRGPRPRGARRSCPPRRGPHRRRAIRGAAAQRGRPAAARRRQPELDRGHRAAGRFQARHHRAMGVRLRPRRDGHRAAKASAPRSATRVRVDHARGVASRATRCFPHCSTCSEGTTPSDPEGFDEDAEFQRAVDLAGEADVAVVVAGEWQNMIGEAGLAVVAGAARDASWSCCRPSSRPVRRSCCWS